MRCGRLRRSGVRIQSSPGCYLHHPCRVKSAPRPSYRIAAAAVSACVVSRPTNPGLRGPTFPHCRQHARRPRTHLSPAGQCPRSPTAGKHRFAVRPRGAPRCCYQSPRRFAFVHIEQLDAHQWARQLRYGARLDLHQHQPLPTLIILDQSRSPFLGGVSHVLPRAHQPRA